MPDQPAQQDVTSLLRAVVDSDPRIREAFETFSRNGQVPVAQVEPVLGDTILNAMRRADGLDGRHDNHISRQTIQQIFSSAQGLSVGQRLEIRSAIAAIPPEGIRLHPENVNRVVSGSLRRADSNDDWQLNQSELMALAQNLGSQAGELVERPNVPNNQSASRRRQ